METFARETATIQLIKSKYNDFAKGQKRIADYIINNPSEIAKITITELSERTNNKSEASIVKFYHSLGFPSFQEFKIRFLQEYSSNSISHSYEDILENDSAHDIRMKIFKCGSLTIDATAHIDCDKAFEDAAKMIINADRIVLIGYAASAAVCYYAQFRFLELGANCVFSSDSHINAAMLVQPRLGDVYFCISMSGETRDIVEPLRKNGKTNPNIIALTGATESTLAKMATVLLPVHVNESQEMIDAMSARLAQICSIDVLFTIISVLQKSYSFARLRETRKLFKNLREKTNDTSNENEIAGSN